MQDNRLEARPQKKQSAPDYVIAQLRRALATGQIRPGDRLPSEGELETLYGVSRGSVRQAMKSLEMLGVVTIRPGDGTYVNRSLSPDSFNSLAFALLLSRPSVRTITEARYALERDILELILQDEGLRCEVLPALRENLEEHRRLLAQGAAPGALVANDQAFHRILSAGCGNPLLQTVYDYLLEAFSSDMLATTSRQQASREELTLRDHGAILAGIEAADFGAVKRAVERSMESWGGLMDRPEEDIMGAGPQKI
jgi:GntR family transcriptional repressor for pyruvate dehydrogenase complex